MRQFPRVVIALLVGVTVGTLAAVSIKSPPVAIYGGATAGILTAATTAAVLSGDSGGDTSRGD